MRTTLALLSIFSEYNLLRTKKGFEYIIYRQKMYRKQLVH